MTIALFMGVACSQEKKDEPAGKETRGSGEKISARPASGGAAADAPAKDGKYLVTFVELGSVRCIPCKKMQPIMKEIEEEYADKVKVVFHDVWTPEGKPYAQKYGIRVIPTQVFLDKDGKEYFRHEGFFPKDELVKVLKQKGV
ncbi:MAG: thioredoxin [Candidatus Latescibacterota bacterium]|nr:MAG: thioredoxin [Candidatus Latescibacterota bacterium]